MPTSTTMPGPMSQSDGKLLRKLPGAYWSQRLRMGWSSKGLIVRVTMPSITPSLGFFFHLRARLWGRGGGVGVDVEHRWSVTVEGSAKELTQLVTRSPNGAGRPV